MLRLDPFALQSDLHRYHIFMLHALSHTGIVSRLFWVKGDLVDTYNRALEATVGKRTQRTSFNIDKRGESPELEQEFGKNYLQSGPAHRYCIVVSPDQRNADLLHEEFSFDNELLNMLYTDYLSGINLVTRVEGMFGEIDDGVRAYETFEDLLLVKHIHLELHTPSKFLTTARTLQRHVDDLKTTPDLLIADNSALPRKILKLAGEVGDIRGYDLRPVEETKEVSTFYTRLFGGVAVFRNVESVESLRVTRPDKEHFIYNLEGNSLISQLNWGDVEDTETHARHKSSPSKTVVIYREKDYQPEDGPAVQFIRLQDKQEVVNFLVQRGYADYDENLLEARLERLEDETLLLKGHDITNLEKEQQVHFVHENRENMLFEWYELKELKRKLTKGHTLNDVITAYSATTQSMLLTSNVYDDSVKEVAEHVITRLFEYDYEKLYRYNRRHLENIYKNADDNKKKYIVSKIEE